TEPPTRDGGDAEKESPPPRLRWLASTVRRGEEGLDRRKLRADGSVAVSRLSAVYRQAARSGARRALKSLGRVTEANREGVRGAEGQADHVHVAVARLEAETRQPGED